MKKDNIEFDCVAFLINAAEYNPRHSFKKKNNLMSNHVKSGRKKETNICCGRIRPPYDKPIDFCSGGETIFIVVACFIMPSDRLAGNFHL